MLDTVLLGFELFFEILDLPENNIPGTNAVACSVLPSATKEKSFMVFSPDCNNVKTLNVAAYVTPSM
jgi:hypothetical protein